MARRRAVSRDKNTDRSRKTAPPARERPADTLHTGVVDLPVGEGLDPLSAKPATRRLLKSGTNTVQELQNRIEDAFTLLEKATSKHFSTEDVGKPPASLPASRPISNEVTKWGGRIAKTVIGLAIATLVGVVPVMKLLALTSTDAVVNAPVVIVRAPVDGRLGDAALPAIGTVVTANSSAARIESAEVAASQSDVVTTDISSPVTGQVWEVLVQPGEQVRRGQPLLRVLDCQAAVAIAIVSQSVYDRLVIGAAATFTLDGSSEAYPGHVAWVMGQSVPVASYAIPPSALLGDGFFVAVTLPSLFSKGNCPVVGRHGSVVFDPRPRLGGPFR